VRALEASLDLLVQRHESLRTSFPEAAGQASQQINNWHLKLSVVDTSDRKPDQRGVVLDQALEWTRQPFNLAKGPLVRAVLYRLSAQKHLLVMVAHQLVVDGTSLRILNRELGEIYRAFRQGDSPVLPLRQLRYGDFAAWQRQCLQTEVLERGVAFWRAEFQKPYQPLRLPLDHPRSVAVVTPGEQVKLNLPKGLIDGLKAISRQQGATSFTALLGSIDILLHRYTGQEDILTLVSIAARPQPELRELVGLVANVLPLRLDLSGQPDSWEVLRRTSRMVTTALEHQMLPLSRILERFSAPPNGAGIPPIQVLVIYNNTPLPGFKVEGTRFSPSLDLSNGTTRFDLVFELNDSVHGVTGHIKYRSDIFERATIQRLVKHWEAVIEQLAAAPDRPIQLLGLPADVPRARDFADSPVESSYSEVGLSPLTPATGSVPTKPVEPHNSLEIKLTRIWEQIFGIKPIGRHDNFFGLGGHSLTAVRLAQAIEREIGSKLRLSTIFRAPTIARQAEAIAVRGPLSDSSIIEIQTKGSKAPLFLVHGVGGGMFWGYRNLSQKLGPEQPMYVFKSRGMDGLEEFTRVEDIAEHYVADLRKFQPKGPYHIGGYCFGGNVAYEMARQLTAQGQSVALLWLINCWPSNSSYTRLSWTPLFLAKAAWNLGFRFAHQVRFGARQPRDFFKWRTTWLRKRLKAFFTRKMEDKVDVEDFVDLSPRPEHERRLWRTHVQAWLQYQPQPYSGQIILFRTRGHPLICSFDREMGWGSFAAGGVVVKTCPGDHESILEQQNVGSVAEKLQSILDAVEAVEPQGEGHLAKCSLGNEELPLPDANGQCAVGKAELPSLRPA
jgi:thioesterase domain-containing protein